MFLEVSKSELSDRLELLPEISPLLIFGQAQLFYDGKQLTAKGPVSSFEVDAVGGWWQVARVPMQFFYGLRGRLPEGETIRIWRDNDTVRFNSMSITAEFQDGIYDDYPLSVEAGIIDLLRLRKLLNKEQIDRSGLAAMVDAALDEINYLADHVWDEIGDRIEEVGFTKRQFWAAFLNGIV